jgi:hypothetical protein
LAVRRDDKVDVIVHQTVPIHGQIETFRCPSQNGQEHSPVIIYEENVLLVIAPLSNMMSTTCDYNS